MFYFEKENNKQQFIYLFLFTNEKEKFSKE
jgi:hypothetical protein